MTATAPALAESQLEAEKAKSDAIQSRFDSYRSQIDTLQEVDGQPITGDGIEAIASDRRKAVADVEFPADAKASEAAERTEPTHAIPA